MTKPLRIVGAVAEHDIPGTVEYQRPQVEGESRADRGGI
jgi:hypothetical protein